MLINKPLRVLLSLSVSLLALQAGAEQAPAPGESSPQQAERPATEHDDWTWFGMGFESRQDQFRRDMDADLPGGSAGAATSSGGNGQGGGK
jgi:hypothetical protein